MKRSTYLGALLLVVAFALAISVLLFPFYQQISLMLADEGYYTEALQRYQGELSKGQDTLPVLVSTVNMLSELARNQEGLELAARYVDEHPDEPEAVAFLLNLYGNSNREDQFLALFLKRGPKPAPEKLLRSAQDVCESLGDVNAEVPILEELVYHNDGTAKEHYRLAYFLAARGEEGKAADVIQLMLKKFPIDSLSNVKIDLSVRILVRQNRMNRAMEVAKSVLTSKEHQSEYFDVISIFVEEEHPREGLAILDLLPEKLRESELGIEVRLSLLDSLGETKAYYELVNSLIATNRLTPRLFSDALPPILDDGSSQLLMQMTDAVDLRKVNIQNLRELTTRSVDKDEPALARKVYKSLGNGYLDSFPALLLALALGMGDMNESDATLRYDSMVTRLTDRERAFLAPLFEVRGMDKLARSTLASVQSLNGFTPQEVFALALKFVGFGMVDRGQALINTYANNLSFPPEEVRAATILLKIGNGDVQQVESWIAKEKTISEPVLKGFFQTAFERKYARIAKMSADRLQQYWPSDLYRSYVAAAGAIGDKPAKGLGTLREMYAAGEPVAGLYVEVLAFLNTKQPNLQAELARVVNEEAHNPMVSPHQLRKLGYLLINDHLASLASPLFERLAENSGLVSDDVQALLYTWGAHPSPVQQEWMVKRAVAAPLKEEVKWLTYFAEADEPELVLETIQRSPEGDREDRSIMMMHLQALVATKQSEEATALLLSMLEDETDLKNLKLLASIAQGANLMEAVEATFCRILEVEPDDLETLKAMGILAYGRGDVITAREFLEYYLAIAEGDYLVNFYYGGVLDYYRRFDDAKSFYAVGLQQIEDMEYHNRAQILNLDRAKAPGLADRKSVHISNIDRLTIDQPRELSHGSKSKFEPDCGIDPGFEENIIRAHLLTRLECFESAIDWYGLLIREQPQRLGLYNDLADLFIDRECYNEAASVIAMGLDIAEDPSLPIEEHEMVALLQTQQVRLLVEENRICAALKLAKELTEEYPENSQVLEIAASVQLRAGNWVEALDFLDAALDLTPERTILWDEHDAILVDHQPYWVTGVEYRTSGGQHETLLKYHFENDILPCYRFYTDLELDYGSVTDFALYPSGDIIHLKRTRERATVGLIRQWGCGGTLQGALLLSQGIVGTAFKAVRPDSYGVSILEALYREPCWDLVQSTFQEGARNRILGTRIWRPLPRHELTGTLGYNQYNLMDNVRMATSYLLQAGWSYRLSPINPWLRPLGYGSEVALACYLDKEHVLSQKTIVGDDGVPFQPLGLVSREIYTGSLILVRRFHDYLAVDGSVGLSYDRVPGRGGPEGTFGMTIGRKCGLQGRLLYRHTVSTTGLVTAEDAVSFDLRSPF